MGVGAAIADIADVIAGLSWCVALVVVWTIVARQLLAKKRRQNRALGKGKPLPVRHQEEPIRAFKRAGIAASMGEPRLRGVAGFSTHGVEATAYCAMRFCRSDEHVVPVDSCTCGFYAVDRKRLRQVAEEYSASCLTLEVELYGRVVRCKKGWRAGKQRVLTVHVDPRCHWCLTDAVGVCCNWPVCDQHLGMTFGLGALWTPLRLANAWGVDVQWASGEFDFQRREQEGVVGGSKGG